MPFWIEPDMPDAWERWVRATGLHEFVLHHSWMWPTLETLHYLGLSMLLGTVGVFDLRVLGLAKGIAPATLHKLIPFGIGGYCLNLLTGITFFSGFPEQYAYNPSFWWQAVFMAVPGVNVAFFYLSDEFRRVKLLGPHADAPWRAKFIAGTSLSAWVLVLICGRLLTFFRPPFFH